MQTGSEDPRLSENVGFFFYSWIDRVPILQIETPNPHPNLNPLRPSGAKDVVI
jgi:hypothetical protein